MVLFKIFFDSLVLLKKQPKIFLPKIIMAFLAGALMILTANLTVLFLQEVSAGYPDTMPVFFEALFLLILVFIVFFVDVFVNAMYPCIVRDFLEKKRVSLLQAMLSVKGKFFWVFLSIVIPETLLALPLALISVVLFFTNNFFALVLFAVGFLIFYLVLAAAFYFVYPLLVLKEVFFFRALSESVKLSRRKISKILLVSLLPFSISILTFALAFLVKEPSFLLLFVLLRFLMALMQTYHMVLNPTIFLKYDEL
jgi:hypothetical protein